MDLTAITFHLPRRVSPRHERGSDWDVACPVIAARDGLELRWWPGHMTWSGIGSREHFPGRLIVVTTGGHSVHWDELAEGGRLSRKRLRLLQRAIDAHFGPGTGDLIATHWTRRLTLVFAPTLPRKKPRARP